MTALYSRFAARAADLLAKYGQVVTLAWRSSGSYDPATGSVEITTSTQECRGLEESYAAHQIDGTNILTGDTKFMLSPVTTSGEVIDLHEGENGTMTLTLSDGTVRSVVKTEPLRPAGTLVSATLQLRGA